jgi:hypothetical protein
MNLVIPSFFMHNPRKTIREMGILPHSQSAGYDKT